MQKGKYLLLFLLFFYCLYPLISDVIDGVISGVRDGVKKELVRVIQAVINDPGISAVRIARNIGKAKPTAERYIKMLRDVNVLEFKGAPKTGGYYLTNSIKEKLDKLKA